MTDALRNAVWHSLVGPQSDHAEGTGLARRFHPDVSVFYAIDEPTADAWHDLAALADGRGRGAVQRSAAPVTTRRMGVRVPG